MVRKQRTGETVTLVGFIEIMKELGGWQGELAIDKELLVTQLWLLLVGYQPEESKVSTANC